MEHRERGPTPGLAGGRGKVVRGPAPGPSPGWLHALGRAGCRTARRPSRAPGSSGSTSVSNGARGVPLPRTPAPAMRRRRSVRSSGCESACQFCDLASAPNATNGQRVGREQKALQRLSTVAADAAAIRRSRHGVTGKSMTRVSSVSQESQWYQSVQPMLR